VLAETLRQDAALIRGIAAYRRHPWERRLADPPPIWAEGASRLLDYGTARRQAVLPAVMPAVMFVPSLVNRATVLDLAPGASMVRFLAAQGLRPLVLDWGWPEAAERRFGLTDYVAGRLERAIAAAAEAAGPVVLAGYCMGGLLAIAAALRRPERLRGLALLATPWDFHADGGEAARTVAGMLPLLEPALAAFDALPVDLIQSLFAMLDPFGVGEKYRAFAALDQGSARAQLFVALEDWLNDGVPLAAPVARECLQQWYGENAPARLAWRIAGLPVDPAGLRCPTLVAVPANDRIVPPASAKPLATLIPGAAMIEVPAGHVGMIAGRRAEHGLWRPLAEWVARLPAATGR
jgi:poly(3-hydroxyalkanoate) synthetase